MKLKKGFISAIALASILNVSSVIPVSADELKETNQPIECPKDNEKDMKNKKPKGHGMGLFMRSVEELQKDGILSEQDVKNIGEFQHKEVEKMVKERYQKTCEKIDEMVKEKVITKEQGTKLKESIEKKLESMTKPK